MLPRLPAHPCNSERFGVRFVTVSLVTGDVYTADFGPVGWWDKVCSALWVWCVLNEGQWVTDYGQAEFAVGW